MAAWALSAMTRQPDFIIGDDPDAPYMLRWWVAPAIDWTPGRDVEGAYRVGHSQPPHPADGMTATVCIGDGAFSTILNPASFNNGSLGWTLTYGNAQAVRLTARSVIESYDYLLSGATTMKDATRRLRLLRNARRDLNRRACQEGAA
jgi:hypothetical protein